MCVRDEDREGGCRFRLTIRSQYSRDVRHHYTVHLDGCVWKRISLVQYNSLKALPVVTVEIM